MLAMTLQRAVGGLMRAGSDACFPRLDLFHRHGEFPPCTVGLDRPMSRSRISLGPGSMTRASWIARLPLSETTLG
jgi:hypothetical protein